MNFIATLRTDCGVRRGPWNRRRRNHGNYGVNRVGVEYLSKVRCTTHVFSAAGIVKSEIVAQACTQLITVYHTCRLSTRAQCHSQSLS